jgi:hypothetical protein
MATRARLAFLLLLAGLGLLAHWGLDATRPRATWLRLDGPTRLPLPGPASFRVELSENPRSGFLHMDLRWRDPAGRGRGTLASERIPLTNSSASSFEMRLNVPRPPELDVFRAVIYLSPHGRWKDHGLVATTDWIRVDAIDPAAPNAVPARQRLAVYVPEKPGETLPPVREGLRFVTAGFLVGSGLLLRRAPTRTGAGEPSAHPPGHDFGGRRLALVFALAALIEALNLASGVVDWVRQWAVERSWYLLRGAPQYVISLIAISLGLGLAIRSVSRPQPGAVRLCLAGLFLWGGFAATTVVSLHLIDRVDRLLIPGFSALQLARLASALAGFAGAVLIVRRRRNPGAPERTPPDPSAPSRWSNP